MSKPKKGIIAIVVPLAVLFATAIIKPEWIRCVLDAAVNTAKWIVWIDNAETGLSLTAETVIKALFEFAVIGFCMAIGISYHKCGVWILSVIGGYALCVAAYFFQQYLVYILIVVAVLIVLQLLYYFGII